MVNRKKPRRKKERKNNGKGDRIMVDGERATTQGREVQYRGENNGRGERVMAEGNALWREKKKT